MPPRSPVRASSIPQFTYAALSDEIDETAPSTAATTQLARFQQWSNSMYMQLSCWLDCHKKSRLALIIALIVVAVAAPFALAMHFVHKTTFPPSEPRVGFQSGSGTRSTFNIIWMCLIAILAAVYETLHFNVKSNKLRTIAMDIIAPEVILGNALHDLLIALRNVNSMKDASNGQWSLVHAFSRNMGAFSIVDSDGKEADFDQWLEWQKQHRTPEYLERLHCNINNSSKKDIFAKSIACLQIFIVLVQTITRKAESLYITELELDDVWIYCMLSSDVRLLVAQAVWHTRAHRGAIGKLRAKTYFIERIIRVQATE